MEFVICILKTLLGQSFIPPLLLPLFFGIAGVVEVVVKLILRSEPLHVLIVHGKVLRFALCNKSGLVFFSQLFVLNEWALIFLLKIHKPTLVGPPCMRDDL
jgi:hypothetical protein